MLWYTCFAELKLEFVVYPTFSKIRMSQSVIFLQILFSNSVTAITLKCSRNSVYFTIPYFYLIVLVIRLWRQTCSYNIEIPPISCVPYLVLIFMRAYLRNHLNDLSCSMFMAKIIDSAVS